MSGSSSPSVPSPPASAKSARPPSSSVEDALKTFQLFQPEMGALVRRVQSIELDVGNREKSLKTEQENLHYQKVSSLREVQLERDKFEEEMKSEKQKLKEATDQHDHKVQWDREALQREKDNFEEAQNRAIKIAEQQEPVTVEVGGEKFRTELHTLAKCQGSVFPKLVESLTRRREEDGRSKRDPYIFIDRDGKHFRFILNYLRQGKQVMKCSAMRNPDNFTLNEILYDVQFYKIKGLELLIIRKAVSLSNKMKFEDLVKGGYFKPSQDSTDKFKYMTSRKSVLENLNLVGMTFEKVKFAHPVTFINCILVSARFIQCNFKSVVNFTNVDVYNARFDNCEGLDYGLSHDTDISEAIVNP